MQPLAWVILEDVALDARPENGKLVARTSARQVAQHLGIDPGTAARALRVLRDRGLLVLEREKGPGGRFGLSVYALGIVSGLTSVPPAVGNPRAARAVMVQPHVVDPRTDETTTGSPEKGASGEAYTANVEPSRMPSLSARSALEGVGQQTLELDGGIA
ncbi:MAG TPA: winged helix-turn-helix domain-containing protein [Acidimicrobiales bacterium]|nr:winged helix-turn-helix domain-containing protein [Acidimicrobiales bacterium]